MRPLFAALLIALTANIGAAQQPPSIVLSSTTTGINGENLQDTPVSDAINMQAPLATGGPALVTNQLSLTLTVTPGTTTTFTVKCAESESGSSNTWAQITVCDSAAAAACAPDVRTYTLANYTTQNSTKVITSSWRIRKKYAQCTLDDAANGTGTVVVTGTRSWQ